MFVSVSVQGWELNRCVCVCVEKHLTNAQRRRDGP